MKLCSEKAAPLAEFSSKGVEQILERESPKAPEGENNLGEQEPLDSAASESTSGAVVGDDFKDAVERLQPEPHAVVANETAEGSTVSQETGVDRVAVPNTRLPDSSVGVAEEGVPPIEPPELASGKTETSSYIAAGLSNVRLPLPRQGATGRGMDSVVEADDTDGEGEFHDAYDTVADLVKDADKALEMKQAGNGWVDSRSLTLDSIGSAVLNVSLSK